MLSTENAAARLGMKPVEVVAVQAGPAGGTLATTHDGQVTYLDAKGRPGPLPTPTHTGPAGGGPLVDVASLARLVEQSPGAGSEPGDEQKGGGAGSEPDGDSSQGGGGDLEVPKGTIEEILGWVDGDPQRARAALTAEQATSKPRGKLVAALEPLAAGGQGEGGTPA